MAGPTIKIAHYALAALLLVCAAMLPFAPETDDSDENFGRATVQTVFSRQQAPVRAEQKKAPMRATSDIALESLSQMSWHAGHESGSASAVSPAFDQLVPPLRT